MLRAVLFDVDFTLCRPGPELFEFSLEGGDQFVPLCQQLAELQDVNVLQANGHLDLFRSAGADH